MHAEQYVAVTRSDSLGTIIFYPVRSSVHPLDDFAAAAAAAVQLLLAVTFEIKQLHFRAHSFTSSAAAAAAATMFAVLDSVVPSSLVSSPSLLTHHAALLR